MRHLIVLMLLAVLPGATSCSKPASVAGEKPSNENDVTQASDAAKPDAKSTGAALAVFNQRILPIMQAKNPSSCAECHLSGVDLKQYIHESQEKTFASMRDAGLIDVKNPDASKILKFIGRAPKKSTIVSAKVRKQELEAFRAWIHAAVKDPTLAMTQGDGKLLGPTIPDEVIRHARTDRVLASFIDNVWTEIGRCAACHSPDRNQKQVAKHGEEVSWITLGDPQATLDYMLEADLIDTDKPEKSLILMKPTLQLKHGGGQKMVIGDRTYKQFRRFIEDYTATIAGKYKSADELPKTNNEVSVTSEIWMKLTGVPAEYDKMLLQVDLYRWQDGDDPGWSKTRWATADRPAFGKGKLWQQSLTICATRGTRRAEQIAGAKRLPPGRYLAKIYIDREGQLKDDYRYVLGEAEFVGQVEITSRWPGGYGRMTVAKFPQP
ncbi:MAG: hypothetical protein IID44_24690 [Planctomycetes bacterium]|nr:hypothetical protein [Planctomycetota bacterium]